MPFPSGTPLAGRYLLLDQITAGPQAAVWRGMDDVLGRPVAVKIYLSAARDAQARAFVHARARTAARLNHPHATAVYDFGDAPGPSGALLPYVVMELLDGEPLAGAIPLGWPLAVRVAAEVAGALAASHARDVVHGRVGTAAVMLTGTGAKLLGLAGPGRPPAVPPRPADDVRALGLLLVEALCGPDRVPGLPDPVPGLPGAARLDSVPGLPDAVRAACLACLAPARADRPAMASVARTLATEVNRYAGAAPAEATVLLAPVPPAPPPTPRRRPSRAHTALAAAGTATILALSGVAVRYGDDLLAAATGPGPDSSAISSDARTSGGARDIHPGQAGGTLPGSAGPEPGTSGPPTTPPVSSADPGPSLSGNTSPADALAQLRASVDEGRAAGEITTEVATQFDEAVDDLVRRVAAGENIRGRVVALQGRIESWVRTGEIAEARGTDLSEKLEAYAEQT